MPTIYNEVTVNAASILSLRNDTVDAQHLLQGYTAHDRYGNAITGSYTAPAPSLQSKTVQYIPSTSSQQNSVTPDSGYDGLSSVTVRVNAVPVGTVANPTATKGTVSNHAVSVTPSVTYGDGYISAGSKTGTGVTVSASELVSGTLQITENGETDVTNYEKVNVQVSSGGGGAANFVEGTFTPTTAGSIFNVSVPYTGSGYPIAIIIAPAVGAYNSASGSFYSLVQRYCICTYAMYKARADAAPTYSSSNVVSDQGVVVINYKNSTSSATTYGAAQSTSRRIYSTATNPSSTNTDTLRFRSSTQFSVMTANTSYGFAANIEYAYHIIYSE